MRPYSPSLAGALLALVVSCGGGGPVRTAEAPATLPTECTPARSLPDLGAQHIRSPAKGRYNSIPPTSGEHYDTPVRLGIYEESIPNEFQVHNLEHGHVLVQYRNLTEDQVNALEGVVSADPRMVILAPYPDMDPVLALTSWGRIQTCDAWAAGILDVVRSFIRANRDRAPESVP